MINECNKQEYYYYSYQVQQFQKGKVQTFFKNINNNNNSISEQQTLKRNMVQAMQAWLPEYDYSTRNAALAPIYADFEKQKEFYLQRRKETQEVIDMLQDRIEAELTYAMRLDKISNHSKSFKLGNIAEEVQNFQTSCAARARQAAEVSENVHQDCITPLKTLIDNQDGEYNKVLAFAKKKQDKLHLIDEDIKRTAMAYFKAAQNAEDAVVKYQKIKYEAETTYVIRQQAYNAMMEDLMNLKDCEVEYKETVDSANNFVQKFRHVILKYCRACRDLETERCNQIHSSINQFVVYEMSAEMNNKYDAANFAKVLEDFSVEQELSIIDQHLYGVAQTQRQEDQEEHKAKVGDRSTTEKEKISGRKTHDSFRDSTTSLTSDSAPDLTKDGNEPQEDLRTYEQLCEEITVLPNAFIPIVMNPKFEFVPFESKLIEVQNPMVSYIDINHLTQVQLREPPARVSDFCRANTSSLQQQLNGQMSEQDKKELNFFLLQKIFCIGSHVSNMTPIHKEYVIFVQLISATSPVDRNMFVNDLRNVFQGRQNLNQVVFHNLIHVVTAIYDSYLPQPGQEASHAFNLTDLQAMREFTQQYFMQIPQKSSQLSNQQPLMMTPCLEASLKTHSIWSFADVWLALSKDLEIFTILGIHFFQDQMASYEVDPQLLELVSLRLISEQRSKQKSEDKDDTTSMGCDAEQGCHNRIEQYRHKYTERQEEKQRQAQLAEEQRQLQLQNQRNKPRGSVKTAQGSIGQQLSSLMGGLFSAGGIRIDNNKMKQKDSPQVVKSSLMSGQKQRSLINISAQSNSNANQEPQGRESITRPSLAALLSKSNKPSGRGGQALARRASPAQRMQSPVDEISDNMEENDHQQPAIIARHASTAQIIVKKANYVSHTESKAMRMAASRSPTRSQGLFQTNHSGQNRMSIQSNQVPNTQSNPSDEQAPPLKKKVSQIKITQIEVYQSQKQQDQQ